MNFDIIRERKDHRYSGAVNPTETTPAGAVVGDRYKNTVTGESFVCILDTPTLGWKGTLGTIVQSGALILDPNNTDVVGFYGMKDISNGTFTTDVSNSYLVDSSSYNNDATLRRSASNYLPQQITGTEKFPYALEFTPSQSHWVDISNALRDCTENTVTVSLWFVATVSTTGCPLSINTSTGGNNLIYFVSGSTMTNPDSYATISPIQPSNRWNHIIYQMEPNKVLTTWVNGVKILNGVTSSGGNANNYLTDQMQLGMELDGANPSDFFEGRIAQVRVIKRVVTDAEVQALFEEHIPDNLPVGTTLEPDSVFGATDPHSCPASNVFGEETDPYYQLSSRAYSNVIEPRLWKIGYYTDDGGTKTIPVGWTEHVESTNCPQTGAGYNASIVYQHIALPHPISLAEHPDLLGYYKFESLASNIVTDSSINNRDGTSANVVTVTGDTGYGNAAQFGSTTDRVTITDAAPFDFSTLDSWTVTARVKTSSAANMTIANKRGGAPDYAGWWVGITGGNLVAALYKEGVSPVASSAADHLVLNNNTWQTIVAVFNRDTNEINLWTAGDNTFGTTAALHSDPSSTAELMMIGNKSAVSDSGNAEFYGEIDSVRIYDFPLTSDMAIGLHETGEIDGT